MASQGGFFGFLVLCFLFLVTERVTNRRVLKPIAITTGIIIYFGLFSYFLGLKDFHWSWPALIWFVSEAVNNGVIVIWAFIGFFSSFTVICFMNDNS